MIFRKKNHEDRVTYGTHPGDLGVVVIAAIITLGFIYLLLTPQNFGEMFQGAAKSTTQPAQQPARPGETSMQIFEQKKK